jgi:hypothetical protein
MVEGTNILRTGYEKKTKIHPQDQKINLDSGALTSPARQAIPSEEEGKYAHLEGIVHGILTELMHNPAREKKYKDFLTGAFKLDWIWRNLARLPNPENRFRAFILIYVQQRLLDDIIDGDTPEKIKPKDRVAYAKQKIQNLGTGNFDPTDSIDAFSIKIFSDIEALDPQYVTKAKRRLKLIMESLVFDGERILEREETGSWKFLPQSELEQHFFALDIEGTTALTLFLFGLADSEYNITLLRPLGLGTRVSYNVKDFSADIRAGICNIPKEDAERLRITDKSLRLVIGLGENISQYPENIKIWLGEQITRGRKLLAGHEVSPILSLEMLNPGKKSSFMQAPRNFAYKALIKKIIFPVAYVNEAQATFAKLENQLKQ